VCCSVLQCVAVCCSVLQCVAVCCSVLQCVAVCCSIGVDCQIFGACLVSPITETCHERITVCCSVLQCVAMCCTMLQYVAVCCSMLQYVAVCVRFPRLLYATHKGGKSLKIQCVVSVFQVCCKCVLVHFSVLQCVAVCCSVCQIRCGGLM